MSINTFSDAVAASTAAAAERRLLKTRVARF